MNALPSLHGRKIEAVAIGASAGGISALLTLTQNLPADYRLPLITVLHIPRNGESRLAELFDARLAIPVREALDKDRISAGTMYFAPSDYHLLVERDRSFALSCDEPQFFSRPSIDLMMESAAQCYGPGLAGILLTGASPDGAAGMAAIAAHGGFTIVQDPQQAEAATMPRAALAIMQPDRILPLDGIRELLLTLETV